MGVGGVGGTAGGGEGKGLVIGATGEGEDGNVRSVGSAEIEGIRRKCRYKSALSWRADLNSEATSMIDIRSSP